VRGDARLEKAISAYTGEKGNLQFPRDQPIPYGLINRIVKHKSEAELVEGDQSRLIAGRFSSRKGSILETTGEARFVESTQRSTSARIRHAIQSDRSGFRWRSCASIRDHSALEYMAAESPSTIR
jgi:hypothetical protein